MNAETVRRTINKHYKRDVLIKASDPSLRIQRISTGILALDWALGGGFARNRHTELSGNANVGKTYTTYRFIASAQQQGLKCAFINAENKFDGVFAASAGVDLDSLELVYREDGNVIFDTMQVLLQSHAYDVTVLDSIAALLPKSELETSMENGSYGTAQAKMMSAALRRLTTVNQNTACVYINQMRENIGGSMFARRGITSGGRAMTHYAATRMEFVRTDTIKRKVTRVDPSNGKRTEVETPMGHRVLVRIDKEQTGAAYPGDTTTMVFDYELGGFDPVEDLIYLGLHYELVGVEGNRWHVVGYEDEAKVGREAFRRWLTRNRAVAEELQENIINGGVTDEGE